MIYIKLIYFNTKGVPFKKRAPKGFYVMNVKNYVVNDCLHMELKLLFLDFALIKIRMFQVKNLIQKKMLLLIGGDSLILIT